MIEASESLLPRKTDDTAKDLVPVSFSQDSAQEFNRLLGTLNVRLIHHQIITLKRIHPGTYLSRGKLEQIATLSEAKDVGGFAFDTDLSPNQLKNIEKKLQKPVVDRAGIILEIFSQNAKTKEAKTQVELAKLQYLLPRLAHFWSHFERQRGGGAWNKGMGEKQIEVDRRLVGDRISRLKKQLEKIKKDRAIQRAGRKDIFKVALVGYTNAGKSTLLNQLTLSEAKAEDQLFATLDSMTRALDPDSHPPIVAIDTVGFISRIPANLIASFRSTLEELDDADLFLHIVDGSSKNAKEEFKTTIQTIESLGLSDKERITVVNKCDAIEKSEINRARLIHPGAHLISAFDPIAVEKLRAAVLKHFRSKMDCWEVVIPYQESKVDAQLHQYGYIEKKEYIEKGTFYRVRIHKSWAQRIGLDHYRL